MGSTVVLIGQFVGQEHKARARATAELLTGHSHVKKWTYPTPLPYIVLVAKAFATKIYLQRVQSII